MARIDRAKRAFGKAIKRTKPSRAAQLLVDRALTRGRVLDYGCGYGFDAQHFGWEAYDPYYRSDPPVGPFDTVVCIGVINALSRTNRAKGFTAIRNLLTIEGTAYLAVARNLPVGGKLGIGHSLQNFVVLSLPSVYVDGELEIYAMRKSSEFTDRTREHVSRRDRRRDR